MQEKPVKHPFSARMNIITAICLGLVTLFVYLDVFSFGYGVDLSYSWGTVTEALKSGILYLNADDGDAFLAAIGYFLTSIWAIAALIRYGLKYSRDRSYRSKSSFIWASVLLVVACFLMVYLGFLQASCVDQAPEGSSPVCAAPVHPGIVPPTPIP
jgi:heme A synthase